MVLLDINLVVKSAAALVSNLIKKSTDNFRVSLDENLPKIKGSFQRLEQVVINLLTNACQALEGKEKEISIKTSYDSKKQNIRVEIKDEGTGIKKDDISKIKDPFFTTKRESGGTGLGLSLSSSIIEEHNGTLIFSSETGKGTTAAICLSAVKKDSLRKEV